MRFTLEGSAAGGAQAAGQGLGNLFKAAAMAPMYKQQAEQDTNLALSKIYANNMSGNKSGAEAALKNYQLDMQKDALGNAMLENQVPLDRKGVLEKFINTGSFGGEFETPADGMGPVLPAPVDPAKVANIARAMSLYNRTIGTGSNVQQMAKAATEGQTQRIREGALKAPDIDTMNRMIAVAGDKIYTPFDNVGNTGFSINKATGGQAQTNDVLAKIFSTVQNSIAEENRQQSRAAGALANTREYELSAAKNQAANGDSSSVSSGKPLTNAQLRANQDIDAARAYVKDLPRETVANVLRKNSMDLSEGDKDVLARIKKARTAKYGEGAVPGEYNDALGLDQNLVNTIANALANPQTKKNWFGADRPYTEQEIVDMQKKSLPESEKANLSQYVAVAKQRNRNKNPAPSASASTMEFKPTPDMLKVQADFKAGKITRQEATKKLKELGMPD